MQSGADKPHVIVFANEKGGTGKSTTAVHTAAYANGQTVLTTIKNKDIAKCSSA